MSLNRPPLTRVECIPQQPGQLVKLPNFEGVSALRVIAGGEFGARLATSNPGEGRAPIPTNDGRAIPLRFGEVWADFRDLNTGNPTEYPPLEIELYDGNLEVFGSTAAMPRIAVYHFGAFANYNLTHSVSNEIANSRFADATIHAPGDVLYPTFTRWGGFLVASAAFYVRHVVDLGGTDYIVSQGISIAQFAAGGLFVLNLNTGLLTTTGMAAAAGGAGGAMTGNFQSPPSELILGITNRLVAFPSAAADLAISGRVYVRST